MKIDRGRRIRFGEREIPYDLHTMPRKRLRIVVRPDLSVRVEAPEGCSEEEISDAVHSKGRWLVRQLDQLANFHPLPKPYRYVSGESLLYLGRQYRLRVYEGDSASAKLLGRYLRVPVQDKSDRSSAQAIVEKWYRDRADDVFSRSMDRCLTIARRHGAERPALVIRRMRTRWGSYSARGTMTLNVLLVQAPVHCIDYVVMHEICHTIERNHSKAFYRLLRRCMPDWEIRKRVLNEFCVYDLG